MILETQLGLLLFTFEKAFILRQAYDEQIY